MQGEWDIEMVDDDDELSLVPGDELSPNNGEGATIQDILGGGRNRFLILLSSPFDSAFRNAGRRKSPRRWSKF
jgi:hypothetical protein